MDKGAHFHRCDFQVHSPRDHRWKGQDCITPEQRQIYAASLMRACRLKGLHAIAITDHHDMLFVPYVRRAAEEETDDEGNPLPAERRFIVFPGIELTLDVPCQALLLLDADFPENMFQAVMTALALTPAGEAEAKTAAVERLNHIQTFRALKEELDKHKWLQNRYIVFPNVTGEGEHSLLRKGQSAKYADMPCVGGYTDGNLSTLKEGARNILGGKDKAWGNKRIACFQTSDNRREDHANLATHTTWVKWAAPTAEALRQACLAEESRISYSEPRLPTAVIASVSVSNSSFLGPIELSLNPQYNTLIGGRGTGKSTILEYLRWALCDQPPGIADEDTPSYQSRRIRLIEQTLKPFRTTVEVNFVVNEVIHVVRRDSADGSLLIKIGTDEMRACTEAEVRTLLPIQAYSQKQLSDVSVRIDELTRFITTPIRTRLDDLDRRIEERAERVRQTYAARRRQQTLSTEIAKRALEAQSLQQQADAIRASLSGLSEADRSLLDQGKTFETADQNIASWQADIQSLAESATSLRRMIESDAAQAKLPADAPEPDIVRSAFDEYQDIMDEAKAALDSIIARAGAALDKDRGEDSPWERWRQTISAFRVEYTAAVQRSSAQRERMEQLQNVERRLASHQRETARLSDELKNLRTAEEAYIADRHAWRARAVRTRQPA